MSTFDYGHKGQLDYLDLMTMLSPSYSKEQAELRKLVESVMCTPAQSGVRAWARERVPEYSGRAPIVLPTISAVHHGPSRSAMVPRCGNSWL
jgi:hypothetical protein